MTWKLVGESTFTKEERDPTCFRLVGDVSTLTVPLSWPIPKVIERYLVYNDASKIVVLWQALVAQSATPDRPNYVEFPKNDVALRPYYTQPDGEPLDVYPWDRDPLTLRPSDWANLLHVWYMEQVWFTQRDLVRAFGTAMEELTGLPLERSAPSLHLWLSIEPSGEAVSAPKPASTSTKKTPAKSGRQRTTASPAA